MKIKRIPQTPEEAIIWNEERKKKKRTIVIVTALIIVIIVVLSKFVSIDDSTGTDSTAHPTGDTVNANVETENANVKTEETTAIVILWAGDLASEYKENEVRADNNYKNRNIYVKGIIDTIGKDILNNTYVTLGTGSEYEIYRVQVYFSDKSEIAKVANLNKGDEITIYGKCKGFSLLSVTVDNGKIQ